MAPRGASTPRGTRPNGRSSMGKLPQPHQGLSREIWRPVEGTNGVYQVSNRGRVQSLDHYTTSSRGIRRFFRGKMLRVAISKSSGRYARVAIRGQGRDVHSLVAGAFLGPRPAGTHVNHRNGDKSDNRVENLEYVTPAENAQHAWRTGLMEASRATSFQRGWQPPQTRLTPELVRYIRLAAFTKSQRQIAREIGFHRSTVQAVIVRRTWRHID